jgi:hypothetical protein
MTGPRHIAMGIWMTSGPPCVGRWFNPHGSPDVQLAWKGWVVEEVILLKGTSDPVLDHAISISGDTEDVGRGGTVLLVLV